MFVCLVVLFYGISTLFGSFNAELSHFDKSFKQFSTVFYTQLNIKTSLFQTVQFSISTQFRCEKQFNFKPFGVSFSLDLVYGISTIVGYSMPNPFSFI